MLHLKLLQVTAECVVCGVWHARCVGHVVVAVRSVDQSHKFCVSLRAGRRHLRHQTISNPAMLAASVFTPTPTKAIVTSSSLRVSLEVTTMPLPKRGCCTRSPSRK